MEENKHQEILEKYIYDKPLLPEETEVLIKYLRENREQPVVQRFIEKAISENLFEDIAKDERADIIYQNILDRTDLAEVTPRTQYAYGFWRVAASILFIFGISWGGYKYYQGNNQEIVANGARSKEKSDAAPGTDKAYLKLANGDSILLTQTGDGMLTSQGGSQVSKQGGLLSYNMNGSAKSGEVVYNTLNIPRGGKFQLILADGTKVWMNAASSLRFPTAFVGRDRRVVLTGEAYFEVAKNKALPFIVEANGMEVKVLGTHFNVGAYQDESAIKTTLVEGSVHVRKDKQQVLLSPGKQSTLTKATGAMHVENANLDEALAWKNELFVFKNSDIKSVMRQLSRWYDIDVIFKGEVNTKLNGMISRNTNLSGVIKLLQLSGGAQFKINGNLITVSETAP
jgi:hypothetical protein